MPLQRRTLAATILLILAVFVSYGNVWSLGFVYDDEFLVQKNTYLLSFETFFDIFTHSSTGGAGFTDSFYRPLQGVAYLFVRQLFGGEPWGFHLLNVTLHALDALLIFALARRLKLSEKAAFVSSVLWAVHPIHTEAITYISGTADPLGTFFMLSSLLVLRELREWKRLAVALLLFACALLSKEAAVVLPALVMVYVFISSPERWKWRSYTVSLPFWLVAFTYLGLRATVLNFDSDFTMYKFDNEYAKNIWLRVFTFFSTIPDYLATLAWPEHLYIDRDYPVAESLFDPKPLVGFALLSAAAIGLVYYNRKKPSATPWWPWVALWAVVAYGPSNGILIPVNSLFLEHWMYLPSISIFMIVGVYVDRTSAKVSNAIVVVALLASIAFGYRSFVQNRVWDGPIALYSHILKYNPATGRVRHNLAMALDEAGRTEEALKEYQFIIDHGGHYPQTYHNLAQIHLRAGRLDEAETWELKAIELAPKFHPPYVGLAKIYEQRGDSKKAKEFFDKAVELVK